MSSTKDLFLLERPKTPYTAQSKTVVDIEIVCIGYKINNGAQRDTSIGS